MDKNNLAEHLFLTKSDVEITIKKMVLENRPGKIILAESGVTKYYIYLNWEFNNKKAFLEMTITDAEGNQIGPKAKSGVKSQKTSLIEDLQSLYPECMYQILDELVDVK